jgi:hypothetical protein
MDMQPVDRYLEGTWAKAGDEPIRARVTPMIADALRRTPLLGIQLIGWDCVMVPVQNAMLLGVAIAIRGVDLSGPGKELMRFAAFSTWKPGQAEVDQIVAGIVKGLGDARAQQSQQLNGHP